jgi:isopentenyl-diphosphate Delta-isomerase
MKEQDLDPTAESRKKDHIQLALKSQVVAAELDNRFHYEPLFAAHPAKGSWPAFDFIGKKFRLPLWVSSMTGGTLLARNINHNLARACGEFGMGMGLGSCRQLLFSDKYLPDFDVRESIGPDAPLFANLGVAQVEKLFESGEEDRIPALLGKLRADGLIIHVNPLQEALQPEGDVFKKPPLETILQILDAYDVKLIVKEVGQGFGPASIRALLQLPLEAIEFAAAGGTNFSKLELLRDSADKQQQFAPLTRVGHGAHQMVDFCNQISAELQDKCMVKQIIVSGGIQDFLEGYQLVRKSRLKAVYGQASAFLKHAQGDYELLQQYVSEQQRGLELAAAYLALA